MATQSAVSFASAGSLCNVTIAEMPGSQQISGETDQCVHGSVQITVLGLGFGYGSD